MTLNLYAIHDKLANNFSNPFALDQRVAMRTFNFMVKERAEIDCADREIVLLGYWNNETGELDSYKSASYYDYETVFDMEQAKKDQMEREGK